MIRFTFPNWNRFFNGKTTTIRMGKKEEGIHEVLSDEATKSVPLGEVELKFRKKCKVKELTEQDAHFEGFNSLDQLLRQLFKVYKGEITMESEVWIYWCRVTKRISSKQAVVL